jgi:hypothetical protein
MNTAAWRFLNGAAGGLRAFPSALEAARVSAMRGERGHLGQKQRLIAHGHGRQLGEEADPRRIGGGLARGVLCSARLEEPERINQTNRYMAI